MKPVGAIAAAFFFLLLLVEAGCEPVTSEPPAPTESGPAPLSAYASYTAEKVDIIPLTEFTYAGGAAKAPKIKVYVSVLDSSDCQIKTPGIFRFELYERVPRSAEPKGGRIAIWPDIDLTGAVENNNHWRDFLRAYEFNLDFEPQSGRDYILEVTCLCPNGKRLSADFGLKHTK